MIVLHLLRAYLIRQVVFWQEWPHALYPPWAHGPGYVVSKDIARFIVQGHRKRGLPV